MKKAYTKPQIAFENFSLSQNIAAGCEVKTHTPALKTCAYGENDYGQPIFLEGVEACVSKVQESENDTFCYHVFAESNNLFNS